MSTADHAGRPMRPSSAGRGPYTDGGGGSSSGSSAGGALRRLAGSEGSSGSSSTSASEPTRPVPTTGGSSATSSSSTSSTTTSPLPKYPSGYTSRTGDDAAVAREQARTVNRERPSTPPNGYGSNGTSTASTTQPTPTQSRSAGTGSAVTPAPETAPARHEAPTPAPARPAPARRVRLTVSRVDPWSAMKLSFLLSVALGIAGVVAVAVLWTVLEGMGVFDQVNGVIGQVVQDEGTSFDILNFVGFTRVVSLSIVVGVIDVILITAIATLGAFLYNVSSALVGGVQLTLTDD